MVDSQNISLYHLKKKHVRYHTCEHIFPLIFIVCQGSGCLRLLLENNDDAFFALRGEFLAHKASLFPPLYWSVRTTPG